MRELTILERVYGYVFEMKDGIIQYAHFGDLSPDAQDVLPLLRAIRERRNEAIEYLRERSKFVDIAGRLWDAAERAQRSARQAEDRGNYRLAQKDWNRSVRLFAAAAKAAGAEDPHIPWKEWIAAFSIEAANPSGDSEKV